MSDSAIANNNPRTLRSLIAAQGSAALSTDDVLVLIVPLFHQVAALHAQGKVAALDADSILVGEDGVLRLRRAEGKSPAIDIGAVHRVQPHPASGLNIVGALQRTHSEDGRREETDLALQLDVAAPIERPVYLLGPASWELQIGHHDEISDIFLLGLMLASLACGLDFADEDDLRSFVAHRRNLFLVCERLHPIVAAVIVEMTEINRHERATDLAALAARLSTWREQPLVLDVERALAAASGAMPRRRAVLMHLRDRLFDLSRRNRLLHFRPSAASVNLTVASVPLMLQIESVRPEHICTWGGPFADDLVSGKQVSLQRWLRFDDQPYLPAALDRLIAETRRDRAEFGFSNLRLVIAFLRWHNLKESPDERIVSPLLWLPVELVKRKGVRDQYVIQCTSGEAEFNPVLRHHLGQLYDIRLPETVDLGRTTLAEIHADILSQIRRSEPAVELRLVDRAAVRLVRQKALQRMQQFKRRRPGASVRRAREDGRLPPYSYAQDDYRPLGRALFELWVRPSELPQRFEAGAAPSAGLRQPHMADPIVETADTDDRLGFALQESEGHRYAWDLDLTQVTLANFNYKKMSLVRDYSQLLDEPRENPAFDRVFSIEPREVEAEAPPPLQAAERWSVVASDATQNAAVGLARNQRSFIIQGPPGTGKSQTITNLIADYAARGKRVLFVCEKRAALDVVFHRLKQSRLEALCCLIHDSQTDKKAFIADLRDCYERWISQPHGSETLEARRKQAVDLLTEQQQRIDSFESAMAAICEPVGDSVRALLRRLAELPSAPEPGAAMRERLPTLASWDHYRDLTQRVHRAMRERFGVDSLAAHPFAKLSRQLLGDERAFGRAEQLCEVAEAQFEALDRLLDSSEYRISHDTALEHACSIATDCVWLLDTGLASHLDLLDKSSPAHGEMQKVRAELDTHTRALSVAQDATSNWRDKLSRDDTESALILVRRLESSPTRWLQPRWWRLRAELKRRYDFGKHAVHPGYLKVLDALATEHAASAALAAADAQSRQRYGVGDMLAFTSALAELERRLQKSEGLRDLIGNLRGSADPLATAREQASAQDPLDKLAQHVGLDLAVNPDTRLGELAELLRDLREALADLPDLLPLLRSVHAGDPTYAVALQSLDYPPVQLDALIADEALRRLERESLTLARFSGAALAQAARAVAQGQRELLALNAEVVSARRHQQFAEHVRQSTLSATQLDAEGKTFKKRYAAGRRELEHEFGKSMRHRSIRELSDDDSGLIVNDLKPIWLMSPLSVSDTLPLSPDLFDVVIFDEASQIPTEESVPALSRASQVVVVGDEMQLPPTTFFSTSSSEDDEIVVEEDGERIAINLDSDSLLNQAARNLPATLLAWHYRSRHESLISFSNAAFYDGRLVTIPDRVLERSEEDVIPVRSDQGDAGIAGADALLARPVSFHRLSDGVYLERCNEPEARYIAQTVRELLRRETGLSLGIVAFSEAQQTAIEAALEALEREDADFAARLEREYVREDDDQFNGLFVKNLENVQGDERDVIILSICYAPGPDGKMQMNFGPINQRGGEKRLNVIFSRARHRMAVVSTIQAEAITNVHNDGAAALRAFLQFAQASAQGQFERAQATLGSLNPGAREAFARQAASDSIRNAMADALRARGHDVHVNVGRSQFRCDLAVVDPSAAHYALAILLDSPAETVTDAAERYVFRPGVLRSFGWRVLDIPGKDWLHDRDAVLTRIESMLADGEDRALDIEVELPAPMPTKPAASASLATDDFRIAHADEPQIELVRNLRFEGGTSHKFWRVTLRGAELSVSYGRVGTSGQTNLKQYDSAERARREMDKLVTEKLRKGYVEE
ncbi:AAA domain-containing protein [Burkholderia sp. Ax-1724]|uniref:AAA domain-containing protein n=1 Tax=Burkholderia sp. Ax-1724 TaxID=2608336 RepID=UPI00142187F3|nr:AAA domain-containing protein [Burkholderia sp. Ax-1724]NIF52787.1 WGR domain-containing protein [Burkholderia sp. Ax-1724]